MPIGLVFTIYGVLVLLIAWHRQSQTVRLIYKQHVAADESRHPPSAEELEGAGDDEEIELFETSGSTVVLLTVVSLSAYVTLIVLLYFL